MRITRSGLRKIIAEEHARILAEMKMPKRDEDKTDADWAEEQEQGVMDMYGDPDPYGDDEALEMGYEYDGAGGWIKPDHKGAKKKAWQVAAEKGGKDCLYVIYGGRSVFYVLAPSGLSEEEAEAEGMEVTGDIAGDEEMANPLELYEFLGDNDFITAVHDIESAGGEVSKAAFMEQLREVGEEEGLFASDDMVNEGEEVHEADKGLSPLAVAEGRLRAAIRDIHPTKASSLTKRVLDLIDDVMMEEAIAAEADGTDEFPFNASVRVLEQMGDTFPGDADLEELHAAIDAVIKPQWRGALESAADAESDRRDVEDTERDLSHPSRFLEEGDDDALDEYGDPNDSDPDGGYMGFMASDDEMNYLRGGGSYSDSPYADNDVPDNRYTRGRAKGFNREPRVRGDDIDSGYDDVMGDDNLSEGEGDSDGPDQYDPDDAEFHADNERQYQNALRFYREEPGSSLKASHSDFDDVRGSAGPVKRFITRGPQGKPARVRGLDIDSGEDDLNESRWAKLAGILKG